MNRRGFIKRGALWVPAIVGLKAYPQALTLADPASVRIANNSTPFSATAAKFSTGDYLEIASLGASDSKLGLISVWLKPDSSSGVYNIFRQSGADFQVQRLTTGTVRVQCWSASSAAWAIDMTSTGTVLAGSWSHMVAAWDTSDANKCKIVINGTEGTTINNRLDQACDYTLSTWRVSSTSIELEGDMAEPYWAFGQWLDLTDPANVQKFRSSGGAPVDLGSNGSTPTGSQPYVYLHSEFSAYGTNSGSAGNFTVTGTLEAATPP